MIDTFIWFGKGARFKRSKLCQPVNQGGLAVPNILAYYQAAKLASLQNWWQEDKKMYWGDEQLGISIS